MITLEQAKRLKDAGFPQDMHTRFVWHHEKDLLRTWCNVFDYSAPDEKEMMEFLKPSGDLDYIDICDAGWNISLHSIEELITHDSFTEALVQACEIVLKQKEEKMKKELNETYTSCSQCACHSMIKFDDVGWGSDDDYCNRMKRKMFNWRDFGNPKDSNKIDASNGFPTWCPLKESHN